MGTTSLINELGYSQSENWTTDVAPHHATAHLFRLARKAGVRGTYLFQTCPENDATLAPRPAICVAEAKTEEEARIIRQKIWNLGIAPFVIILLPDHVRVYTGFSYEEDDDKDILRKTTECTLEQVQVALGDFYAREIDSGKIWETQGSRLNLDKRVEKHLLINLECLGDILIKEMKIASVVAHTLIGKYIYIRYLLDRNIVSPAWLDEENIDIDLVLGRNACISELRKLIDAIEKRFAGKIFPLTLRGEDAPDDKAISYIASVFNGDDITSGQLALDFTIYKFDFIPIELLSSIYEQFLRAQDRNKKSGAYYTPEPLADYLLSELNTIRPLNKDTKVLDPCCGSGVFLVLVYRRLIEMELTRRTDSYLRPTELRAILENNIYGVERNIEACYVTEFSLILTMLSYIEPPELHRNKQFKFPELHNICIFQCDFFNEETEFWRKDFSFDWIVGNPPWIELEPDSVEVFVRSWIDNNYGKRPVARYRACEAFSWRVTDLLSTNGYVAMIIHAKSLSNDQSEKYRKEFFLQNTVRRITNFSNLAYVLFDGRAQAPAATVIYTKKKVDEEKPYITHYGPFVANQLPIRSQRNKRSWSITIYENEIQKVAPEKAEKGEALTWKMALWGTYRDMRSLTRLHNLFNKSLADISKERNWNLCLGLQLQENSHSELSSFEPKLKNTTVLNATIMTRSHFRLSVPEDALDFLPKEKHYIRDRGGSNGLKLVSAPHLFLAPTFAAYSDSDYVLLNPGIGLSAPSKDANYLRALSIYLSSSIANYYKFFRSSSWGFDRTTIRLDAVRDIPVPEFSKHQVSKLANLHREFSKKEGEILSQDNILQVNRPQNEIKSELIHEIDEEIDSLLEKILEIPKALSLLAQDFVRVRLEFNKGKTGGDAIKPPDQEELKRYAETLRDELDEFSGASHAVSLNVFQKLIVCKVKITKLNKAIAPTIEDVRDKPSKEEQVWEMLRQRQSQWVYTQRGLRIFIGSAVCIYKSPRLIDWTRTQALLDSDDIISEVLAQRETDAQD